jgi:hypothetical protein
VLALFQQACFGTINSFCVNLLRSHGHYLGLPAQIETVTYSDAVWQAFMREGLPWLNKLHHQKKKSLLRFVSLWQALQAGRSIQIDASQREGMPDLPAMDISPVTSIIPKGNGKTNIESGQALIKDWFAALHSDTAFVGIPACPGSA